MSKGLKEITVAITASGIAYGPMYLAQEENIWAKYGLKVNLVSFDPTALIAGLIKGEVQIAFSGANVVDAAIKSSNVKVGGTIGTVPFMLYAKNGSKIEDLRGKVVGVSAPGGNNEYSMLTVLRSAGLVPGKDVEILMVGSNILPTISEGKVEAGLLVPPMSFEADKMGLKKLATLSQIKNIQGDYMVGGFNTAYAAKNPEVVSSFYKAYLEASQLTRTEKEKTKAALSKYTKVTDPTSLEEAYKYFVDFWPKDMHIPQTEIQFLLDQLGATTNPNAKKVKPADVIDNQYADAAGKK
jgi:ABC-type nitrate/sulfonate/bicarbonate transport system substrate-binding protein